MKTMLTKLFTSRKFIAFLISSISSLLARVLIVDEAAATEVARGIVELGMLYIGGQSGVDIGTAIGDAIKKPKAVEEKVNVDAAP